MIITAIAVYIIMSLLLWCLCHASAEREDRP